MDKLERHLEVEINRTWEACIKNSGVYSSDQERPRRQELGEWAIDVEMAHSLLKVRTWSQERGQDGERNLQILRTYLRIEALRIHVYGNIQN